MTTPRRNNIVDIGELQLEVLDTLTGLGEGTVYDVLDRFEESRRPRYTTVLTVLRGLEKKGLALHRTQDRTYVYKPTPEAGRVRKRVLRSVLDRVFSGSPKAMLAALLDAEDITPETLVALKALIAEHEMQGEQPQEGENDGD